MMYFLEIIFYLISFECFLELASAGTQRYQLCLSDILHFTFSDLLLSVALFVGCRLARAPAVSVTFSSLKQVMEMLAADRNATILQGYACCGSPEPTKVRAENQSESPLISHA